MVKKFKRFSFLFASANGLTLQKPQSPTTYPNVTLKDPNPILTFSTLHLVSFHRALRSPRCKIAPLLTVQFVGLIEFFKERYELLAGFEGRESREECFPLFVRNVRRSNGERLIESSNHCVCIGKKENPNEEDDSQKGVCNEKNEECPAGFAGASFELLL